VSGGIVTPPDLRPPSQRGRKLISAASGDTQTIPTDADE
jgi:hypothetical protein